MAHEPNGLWSEQDSQSWRAQFPILHQQVHGQPLAYLDNAATTQMPLAVMQALKAFNQHDRANIHRGVHLLSQRATDAYDAARSELKHYFGLGTEHELVFTSGTTEALNTIANGLWAGGPGHAQLQVGDRIIVSGLEHHANLVPWQQAARMTGAQLVQLAPDQDGRLHLADLERLLAEQPAKVFALTACANATGERPPYEDMLRLAKAQGAITILDIAQVAAHGVPALAQLDCDFAAFSGHKMYGPLGIGGLIGRRTALEKLYPLRLGGDMVDWVEFERAGYAELPARLEGGTPNISGAVGLAAAARFILDAGQARTHQHIAALRQLAVTGLAALPGVRVLAPHAHEAAVVSFVVDDVHPHDIGTLLDQRGIAVRTGHHCAQPLLDQLCQGPTTRASFAIYNTAAEVQALIAGVAHCLKVLR